MLAKDWPDERPDASIELLDEERDAVGLADDLPPDLRSQRVPAGDPVDQVPGLRVGQTAQAELRPVRAPGPGALEFQTEGEDQQERCRSQRFEQGADPGERRRIEPVEVLHDQDSGLPVRGLEEELDEGFERPLPLRLGAQREGRTALRQREGEQLGEERQGLGDRQVVPAQEVFQMRELFLGGSGRLQPLAPQQLDYRKEGRAPGVGRAVAGEPPETLLRQAVAEGADQPGFADSGLAADQEGLPLAGLGQVPALQDEIDLLVASHQRREGDRRLFERLQRSGHLPRGDGLGETGQAGRRQGLQDEAPGDQALGQLAREHAVRGGQALETGRQVEGRPQRQVLGLPRVFRDDRGAAVHAGPQGEAGGLSLRPPGSSDLRHELACRPDGPLGVVAMRDGVAEVDPEEMPHRGSEMALEARRNLLGEAPQLRHGFGEILQARGAPLSGPVEDLHQAAADHADLAPLADAEGKLQGEGRRLGPGLRSVRPRRFGDRDPELVLGPAVQQRRADAARGALLAFEPGRQLRERRRNFRGALGPVLRLLVQETVDELRKLRRRRGLQLADRRLPQAADPAEGHRDGVAAERGDAGDHLVEQGAEREEVGPVVHRLAHHLFRRHGIGGAEDHARLRERLILVSALDELREAEVQDLRAAGRGHHDVAGFQIAMDDPVGMRLGEPAGDLRSKAESRGEIERALVEQAPERPPMDELHDDPVAVLVLDDVVDVDDGRVVEAGAGRGLLPEALPEPGALQDLRQNVLECDRALETFIPGAPDPPHAARGDELLQAVRADPLGLLRLGGLQRLHGDAAFYMRPVFYSRAGITFSMI
jgi:hypothetical protein